MRQIAGSFTEYDYADNQVGIAQISSGLRKVTLQRFGLVIALCRLRRSTRSRSGFCFTAVIAVATNRSCGMVEGRAWQASAGGRSVPVEQLEKKKVLDHDAPATPSRIHLGRSVWRVP
jgi:hypothetical protein